MDFVFVVLRCVRNVEHNRLWKRAVSSIREFYPASKIVIIDDNSTCADSIPPDMNISLIQSEFPGAGEVLPYYYFLQHHWTNRMIFMHDSMLLRRAFTESELAQRNAFLWHFEDHQWDNNDLIDRTLVLPELISSNAEKQKWWGCFGACMLIEHDVLQRVEAKYGVITRCLENIRDRPNRMAFERILAIVMFKEGAVTQAQCSINGTIHDHPYAFRHTSELMLDVLKKKYMGPCLKVWIGR